MGTKSGCIYKYQNYSTDLISGITILSADYQLITRYLNDIRFYKSNCIFQNGFIEVDDYKFKLNSKPLDCDHHEGKFYLLYLGFILIVENGLVLSEISYEIGKNHYKKEFLSKISIYKGIVYIYNNSSVFKLCSNCFDLIKVYECNNINIVKYGIVGTKYGCIIINDTLIKVSEYSICDIQIDGKYLYILDSNNFLFKTYNNITDSNNCSFKIENDDSKTNLDFLENILSVDDWILIRNSFDLPNSKSIDLNLIKLRIHNFNNNSYSNEKDQDGCSQKPVKNNCKSLKFYKKDSKEIKNNFSFRRYEKIENIESTGLLGLDYFFFKHSNNQIDKFILKSHVKPLNNFLNFTFLENFSEFKILANEYGHIFLIQDETILDFINLNGSIISICSSKGIIGFTRPGYVYSLEIFKINR